MLYKSYQKSYQKAIKRMALLGPLSAGKAFIKYPNQIAQIRQN
jgi:hypothetical protein